VHPTCGILRGLQAFFWLRVFSTSQTLSTPAHTRVTQTVGRLSRNEENCMDDNWLSDAMKYESEIRNKSVRELCNKKEVEQLRYTLRVALEKLKAAQLGELQNGKMENFSAA
jgi:hypothetical protein